MRVFVAGMAIALSLGLFQGGFQAGEKGHSIKEVMKIAHKGGLYNKVAEGKATSDEKALLVELYSSLNRAVPPQGDPESWKRKTGLMLEVAKRADKGDAQSAKALRQIVNCAACHKEFKK